MHHVEHHNGERIVLYHWSHEDKAPFPQNSQKKPFVNNTHQNIFFLISSSNSSTIIVVFTLFFLFQSVLVVITTSYNIDTGYKGREIMDYYVNNFFKKVGEWKRNYGK